MPCKPPLDAYGRTPKEAKADRVLFDAEADPPGLTPKALADIWTTAALEVLDEMDAQRKREQVEEAETN